MRPYALFTSLIFLLPVLALPQTTPSDLTDPYNPSPTPFGGISDPYASSTPSTPDYDPYASDPVGGSTATETDLPDPTGTGGAGIPASTGTATITGGSSSRPTGASGAGGNGGNGGTYTTITQPKDMKFPQDVCLSICKPVMVTLEQDCQWNVNAMDINSPCVCREAIQTQLKRCFECELKANPRLQDEAFFQAVADRHMIQCANDDDPIPLPRVMIDISGNGVTVSLPSESATGTARPTGTGVSGSGGANGASVGGGFPVASVSRSGSSGPSGTAQPQFRSAAGKRSSRKIGALGMAVGAVMWALVWR